MLLHPMKPMLRTRILDLLRFDEIPAGQNAIVAVMSYSGYDIEDAVILNRASLDRGFGRCFVMKKYVTHLRTYDNQTSDIISEKPDLDLIDAQFASIKHRYLALDQDGIAGVGTTVASGQILVNKKSPKDTTTALADPSHPPSGHRDTPLVYKAPMKGRVDRVMVTSSHANRMMVKVGVHQFRRPELGDKFSSRHG